MTFDVVHRDVKASGIRLRVADSGKGEPVLLLHSVLVDHTTWLPLFPGLTPKFRLVAPDLPGSGASEKPSDGRFAYDVFAFRDAIVDLFAALGLGRATIAGHGLGGAIALSVAADHPELISKLILIDPLCYQPARDWLHRLALTPIAGGLFLKQLWGRSGFRHYFRDTLLGPDARVSNDRLDAYYDSFNTPASRGSALATFRATRDTRPIVAATARVRSPTLVIWGRQDQVYPASEGQRLVRDVTGSGFQLLGAGHLPQEEVPDELARVMERFLT